MPAKPADSYGQDGQEHLAEPKYLKADNPGPCPRPDGCKCNWFPLSLGWSRSANSRCTASH